MTENFENDVYDLTPLSALSNLETLVIQYNKVKDISALSKLDKLERLVLIDNEINDASTPDAVHQSNLDFKVGRDTYEVWTTN